MRNSLSWFLVFFSLGIIFVYYFKIPFWPFYLFSAVLILAGFFLLGKGLSFNLLILTLSFALGALCLKNAFTASKSDISKLAYYGNDTVYAVKGFVSSAPLLKNKKFSFLFRAEEVCDGKESRRACGEVYVTSGREGNFSYGEGLVLSGRLSRPYFLTRKRLASPARLNVKSVPARLNTNKGNLLKKLSFLIKARVEAALNSHLSPAAAGINCAIILGDKHRIPPAAYDSMAKSGTLHIMVVSGFHVGVVAFILQVIFQALRFPRAIRYCAIVFCLIIYSLITGCSVPVARASIMWVFLITAYLLQRDSDIAASLSFAAILILAFDPKALFSASFQLSFASVASIVYLYPFLKPLLKIESLKLKPLSVLCSSCLVSFCAWAGTAGLIAYYFRIFSYVAVLANIFIIPLASLVMLSGLSVALAGLISPSLAKPFAASCELLVFLLLRLSNFFAGLPQAFSRI